MVNSEVFRTINNTYTAVKKSGKIVKRGVGVRAVPQHADVSAGAKHAGNATALHADATVVTAGHAAAGCLVCLAPHAGAPAHGVGAIHADTVDIAGNNTTSDAAHADAFAVPQHAGAAAHGAGAIHADAVDLAGDNATSDAAHA